MKPTLSSFSILFLATAASAIACGSSSNLASSDEDLVAAERACARKSCGDSCKICDPADPNCFETAVLKACDGNGKCVAEVPTCSALDGGAAYDPCGGKSCGDSCKVCDPADPDCDETAVLKACTADGQCVAGTPTCTDHDGGAAYDPCGGKACGESCRICDPADPNCVETAVLKQCNANGMCVSTAVVCGATDAGSP